MLLPTPTAFSQHGVTRVVCFNAPLQLQNQPLQRKTSVMNQLRLSKICLLTDCPSIRPPVLPSFPGSADTSISCSSLSSCLSCPGCVDSSSVSRHGGALRRHGQWSGACALSADGQPAILSPAGLRSKFSFTTKVYFTCSLTCCSSQSLFSCDPFPIPTSPSIADHLAGEPTEKPTDRKHTQALPRRALLRKPASQAQRVPEHLCFSLHVPHDVPAPRLHARL